MGAVTRWWRPALLVALVAASVVVALTVGLPPVAGIRAWVDGAGWAGPVAFAALYAVSTLTPVPASVLSIVAGVLFGIPVGVAVVLCGALTGAACGFAVARVLGRDAVTRVGGGRVARLDGLLRRRGFLAVVGLRLVPLLPFTTLNLAFGLTAVGPRNYLLGTALGILPAATAYVTIGAYGTTPGSVPFLVAVGGLAVLAITALIVHRVGRTREPAVPDGDAAERHI